MPYSNNYSVKHSLKKLFMHTYERYLPTAFDDSMSLLEKMNTLIQAQNQLIDAINTHMEWTNETLERAFDIIDTNLKGQLEEFQKEMEEQKRLYEEIRDKLHSDLMPDAVKQKLEEWLLNGTIEELINDAVFGDMNERLEFLENIFFPPEDKIVYRVPRDFDDLQSAIDFNRKIRNGVDIEILIQSGFKPSKGIEIKNHELKHITIISEDAVVSVADNFTGHFLHGYNAGLPTLGCLVDMRDKGNDGYRADYSSSGNILPQCGVINAGGAGVYVRTSTVTAPYSKFTGANDRGAWITRGANVSFAESDFSGVKGGNAGLYVSRASTADFSDAKFNDCNVSHWAVMVTRSRLNLINGEVNNSATGGIFATSTSQVTAASVKVMNAKGVAVRSANASNIQLGGNADLRNAQDHAIEVAYNSLMNGYDINATRSGSNPVSILEGSKVSLRRVNARNSVHGVHVSKADADLTGLVLSTSTDYGALVEGGSNVILEDARMETIYGIGLSVDDGSVVNAKRMIVNGALSGGVGAESGIGVRASSGSNVNLRLAKFNSIARNAVNCLYGSTVALNGATGSDGAVKLTEVNVPSFNETTGRGVIYN